jgi:hypothetical protein
MEPASFSQTRVAMRDCDGHRAKPSAQRSRRCNNRVPKERFRANAHPPPVRAPVIEAVVTVGDHRERDRPLHPMRHVATQPDRSTPRIASHGELQRGDGGQVGDGNVNHAAKKGWHPLDKENDRIVRKFFGI